jgi:polysaccharide biosynthesis transport protein
MDDMPDTLDLVPVEPSLRDLASAEVIHLGFASVWRHKLLVAASAAAALGLAIVTVLVLPPSYTAEVYIRGGFAASETVAKDEDNTTVTIAAPISMDLVRVIETGTRVLQSHDLARRVVQQLGLDQIAPVVSRTHWLPIRIYGTPATSEDDQIDRAASKLSRHLSVTSDPGAYLIEVRYTDRDPALATAIANAFVAEFLRSSKLQALSEQRALAEANLSRLHAKFGDKHPRVALAKSRLEATDGLMKQELAKSSEEVIQAAGENVTKVVAAPSSPNPRLIVALLLLLGLTAGVGVAFWLERNRWTQAFSRYNARSFA